MKPTIEQLQDALRRYNDGIQYLTENIYLLECVRGDYLKKLHIHRGLCYAIMYESEVYSSEIWVKNAINEKYNNCDYWIQTPYLEDRETQIQLLTRRRDKLIEIIEKYHQL